MEYNDFNLYFGIFSHGSVSQINENGVLDGYQLSEDAVDTIIGGGIYSWETPSSDEIYVLWLGYSDYVYQSSARELSPSDLILISRGIKGNCTNDEETTRGKSYWGRFRGKTRRLRLRHGVARLAKNALSVSDWKDEFYLLKQGANRERSSLKKTVHCWRNEEFYSSSSSWKDDKRRRFQYRK